MNHFLAFSWYYGGHVTQSQELEAAWHGKCGSNMLTGSKKKNHLTLEFQVCHLVGNLDEPEF